MVINGETETGGACGLINAALAGGRDHALMLDEGQLSVRQTQVEYMLKTGCMTRRPRKVQGRPDDVSELAGKGCAGISRLF